MIPTTPATRRRFLEASAGAAIAAWLAPGSTERLLGLVPFVGEGDFAATGDEFLGHLLSLLHDED